MVNDVSAAATTAVDGAAAMKKATGMNKDDFLTLFVTQLKNQDPLNPQDSNQFIAQLAQLSQVEQAYNTNTNLQSLLTAQNNASAVSAVSFIGKEVMAFGNQVAFTAGSATPLNFRLTEQVSSLSVEVRDGAGNLVRTLTAGQTAAGDGSIVWDGKAGNGQGLPSGTYTFAVSGTDGSGQAVAGVPLVTGRIDGVRLDGSSPVLTAEGIEIDMANVLQVKGV